jgi:putative PIN family toxin of toxin-antitoxin system
MSDAPASGPLRLVLDTQVWLDLLVFEDARCAALSTLLAQAEAIALARVDTREEWLRVLRYPALKLEPRQIEAAEHRYARLAQIGTEERSSSTLPRCSDPDDQKFVELAVHAHADAILSRDHALLRMDRRLRERFGLRVLAPHLLNELPKRP